MFGIDATSVATTAASLLAAAFILLAIVGAAYIVGRRFAPHRTARASKQKTRACAKCGRRFPYSQIVYVNHCYHDYQMGSRRVNHNHTDCAGIRELCVPCHKAMPVAERDAYYERRVREQNGYPVEESLVGLRKGGTAGVVGDGGARVNAITGTLDRRGLRG